MAFVVVLVGAALAVPALLDRDGDDPPAAADDDAAAEPDEQDGTAPGQEADPPPPDPDLPVPDVGALDGADAVYGRLLVDIDASERAMIAYQDGLQEAFEEVGFDDADELVARIRDVAREGATRLVEVRGQLVDPLDDAGAEAIRAVYVDHLDAWVRYMEAVEERPGLLDPEVDSERYTLAINTSAEAFARALEQELPGDIADEVAAFADGILDRGFRIEADPQV